MDYVDIYEEVKKDIPEMKVLFKQKEIETGVDETDGIHIIVGMVVMPCFIKSVVDDNKPICVKIFSFLEKMSVSEDIRVQEVLDFTVLEQFVDFGTEFLDKCKIYMNENTLKHCLKIEKYFL